MRARLCLLALVATAGCGVQSEEGISVEVSVLHHYAAENGAYPPASSGDEPRRFVTNLGYEITLVRGYVVLQAVEIVPCSVSRLFHSSSSPTRLGVPFVNDLLREDYVPGRMGELRPPPDEYCRARVVLGPADLHALGLPEEVNLLGKTLYLEGSFTRDGEPPVPFTITSDEIRTREVDLLDEDTGQPAPLLLDGAMQVDLCVAMTYDGWLDSVDLAFADEASRASLVMANAAMSLHHHNRPAP